MLRAGEVAMIRDGRRWLRFAQPTFGLRAEHPDEVLPALHALESAVERRGLHAVGFLSYEAAAAFGLRVKAGGRDALPLLWFGLCPPPEVVPAPSAPDGEAPTLGGWVPVVEREAYDHAVRRVQEHIAAGETSRVNLMLHLEAAVGGEPWSLFRSLLPAQTSAHAAYLDVGRHAICSFSPELFFRLEGDEISTPPTRVTAPRDPSLAVDEAQVAAPPASEESRGRAPFEVECHPTSLPMTSTLTIRSRASLVEILAALFPSASVTGVPKRRAMQIIADLEATPRGLHTGAIGHFAPGRRATFSVAIATAVVDRERGRAAFGVGGGIVGGSQAGGEYAECLRKARFLTEPSIRLLETLRFTPAEGFWLLEEHLHRLLSSARHFGAEDLEVQEVRRRLDAHAATLAGPSRVRLLVGLDGEMAVESQRLDPAPPGPLLLGMAPSPVDRASPWLYHKTTRREVYEAALRARPGCDDVLLWNDRGEVTESTRCNVVVDVDGQLCTPPVACGLLPGTFRARLLTEGRVRERVLPIRGLEGRRIRLVNSVRGWQEAVLRDGAARAAAR